MIVSIHQPMYLPWPPYFAKIAASDIFVIFDNVQYPGGKSLNNRNYICQNQNPVLLTVPLKKHTLETNFSQIEINNEQNWQKKHFKSLEVSYGKSPYSLLLKDLKEFYDPSGQISNFSNYCTNHLKAQLKYLKIDTTIIKASELTQSRGSGMEQILDILKHLDAKVYLSGSGEGSMRYLDKEMLLRNGIDLKMITPQDYKYGVSSKNNEQKYSMLDLLFNLGPNSKQFLSTVSNIHNF